uniref:Filament-like plant protein n=2 Tax=Rhizophora mucronata TaxID=61149 RepID=A0A2P2LU94_RHIMU
MDKRKWLWKRRSSERSHGETESSGSISSHSERLSDDQDALKSSPNDNAQSPEVTSKTTVCDEDANDSIRILTEKLSAALINVSAKDDLVKQHAKVAEEAVAGWEKAENDVVALKNQLEDATRQHLALENRVSHLDAALKECVRQLRQAKEEQEEKIQEAVAKKTHEWESTKSDLEDQIFELKTKAESAKLESPVPNDLDLCHKLECLKQENTYLKGELLSRSEELEVMTIEKDLSTQAAETASKQHLESIKKVAKLEAECRRLKAMSCKYSPPNDCKNSAASSIYVESLTDSQSDCGERLNVLELDTRKISSSEPHKHEPSCSDSWASALIIELDQFKNEKTANRIITSSSPAFGLMDDFLEMERLAAMPQTESGAHHSESEATKEPIGAGSSLRAELEIMIQRTAELEEKLQKAEGEKVELEEKLAHMKAERAELEQQLHKMEQENFELEENLEKMKVEKTELEMSLKKSWEKNEASELQLTEAQLKLEELHAEVFMARESKQQIESQIVNMEAEARTTSEKVLSLEAEVQKEKVLSAEIMAKCQELEDELSRKKQEIEIQQKASSNGEMKIKQEDLDVAAGKLSECQKTIASLGKQLKSLATLEDFVIDTASLPELSAGGLLIPRSNGESWKLISNEAFTPKEDSVSSGIASEVSSLSMHKNEGKNPPSSSSLTSSVTAASRTNSGKNRNGFAKFFSHSKNGVQVEI